MSNLFFNTEIISEDKSAVEVFGDFCLQLVRYLFEGRKIEIFDGKVIKNKKVLH